MFVLQKHLKIFRFNCHICHREGIRMGFATKKRLYRHMAFAHNVDPASEDTEANRDLILNPPPLGTKYCTTTYTVKSRKQAGNYYKPVSSISRYFLKKRHPTTVVFNSVCPPFMFGHLHKILACRSFRSNKLFCLPCYANS